MRNFDMEACFILFILISQIKYLWRHHFSTLLSQAQEMGSLINFILHYPARNNIRAQVAVENYLSVLSMEVTIFPDKFQKMTLLRLFLVSCRFLIG